MKTGKQIGKQVAVHVCGECRVRPIMIEWAANGWVIVVHSDRDSGTTWLTAHLPA
jgi:hypothetical protein